MLLFGNNRIGPIYLGNSEVTSIYHGNELVYTASTPITNYVTFTAQQANSTIGLQQQLSSYQKLWYSIDGEQWEEMTTATTITLNNSGDSCHIAGMLSKSNTTSNYTQFKMTGKIAASGNCNYLWNYKNPDASLKQYCGYYMFNGCDSLTTAPELPATTLTFACYEYMFQGCTSLTTTPELPATTLADGCYDSMFYGCTSLTTAPELPATTLVYGCYAYMFYNCTSLTTAPELPATTLAEWCYNYMFAGCTSLTTAPELPATTLAQGCYQGMFINCSSLTTAPELPATTLASACYIYMFNGCSSLNYIKCLAVNGINQNDSTTGWVNGVASAGTFVKHPNATSWTTGYNGIPTGWVVEDYIPAVKFTAQEANSTIGLRQLSSYQTLEYSTNGIEWNPMTTATTITLANSGDTAYIRGVLSANNTDSNYTQFKMTGKIASNGNCNYLWDYENPDTPLKQYCGYYMFYNCSSLTSAPELPATTLADYCYYYMFYNCSSLTAAPELPATTLARGCYYEMFYHCTSLTTAPELPATTLAEYCYPFMFYGCSNLNYIKCLATNISANGCTTNWVDGVASTGTFVKDVNMTGWTTGVNGAPLNWTVEDAQ